jgi:hypothetical protein
LEEVLSLLDCGMGFRAILWVAVLISLSVGIVRSEDAPNLMGSAIKTEDAIGRSQVIFVGRLVSLGERDNSLDHESDGPEYPVARVKILEALKGTFDDSKFVGIYPSDILKEATPKEGTLYIFFVKYAGNASTPHIVFKVLPVTEDNIAKMKNLISKQ